MMKVDIDMNGSLNIWCETEMELYALEKWDRENCMLFNHEDGTPYLIKNMFIQCHEIMPEGLLPGWKENRTEMFDTEVFDKINKEQVMEFEKRNPRFSVQLEQNEK